MSLQRVTKNDPCSVCGSDSWCMVGENDAMCMKVQSNRPYIMRDGTTGWWHSLGGATARKWTPPKLKDDKPKIDAHRIICDWLRHTTDKDLLNLSESIGVMASSLAELNVAYSHADRAWAFPMRNMCGNIVGIRLRNLQGKKWSVAGSRQGVFMSIQRSPRSPRVYVVEGPTDCAALLSVGLYAIGRPSCSGGSVELKGAISRLRARELVIIADNDNDKFANGRKYNPGMDGALSLQRQIPIRSCIITVPTKDVRDFVKMGGTAADIEDLTKDIIWTNC